MLINVVALVQLRETLDIIDYAVMGLTSLLDLGIVVSFGLNPTSKVHFTPFFGISGPIISP